MNTHPCNKIGKTNLQMCNKTAAVHFLILIISLMKPYLIDFTKEYKNQPLNDHNVLKWHVSCSE